MNTISYIQIKVKEKSEEVEKLKVLAAEGLKEKVDELTIAVAQKVSEQRVA